MWHLPEAMNGQGDARRGAKIPLRASLLSEQQTVVLGWHLDHIGGQALGTKFISILAIVPF
jgi:hypothetical protein